MNIRSFAWLAVVPILAVVIVFAGPNRSTEAGGGITTQDLTGTLEPSDLVDALVGGGITTSNVSYVGADVAAGSFSGGLPVLGAFDSGVILSTGEIGFVVGPNQFPSVGAQNFTAGDAQLTTLSGNPTFDAAVLEFDFVPLSDTVVFRFVFASDEYNEFVNTQFNDVFAFYVNGVNCAVVPSTTTPIAINTINNGNPFGVPPVSNPTLYRNNDADPAPLNTEMDGLTVVLTCLAAVNEGVSNHIKLAIADASDDVYDSVVFIQANSLVGSGPGDTDCNELINALDALFALRFAASLPVNAQCIPNADVNCSGTINAVDALLILRFGAGLSVNLPPGCPPIGSGPPSPSPSASATPSPTPLMLSVDAGDNFFSPNALQVSAGQPFQIDFTNVGSSPHTLHLAGNDNTFETADDVATTLLLSSESGQVQGTLNDPGTYDFVCDVHSFMTGTITAI